MIRVLPGLFVIILCAMSLVLNAQVSLSSNSIPKVNDTLEVRTDKLPDRVTYDQRGQGAFWNFKTFSAPFIYELIIKPAFHGSYALSFRNADGVVRLQSGFEMYTLHDETSYSITGYGDYDFMGLGLKYPSFFDKPYPIKQTTIKVGDEEDDTYTLVMPIKNEDIPNEIFKALPYTPDSARYVLVINRNAKILGSGTLDLHIDNYEVLRESITETQTRKLEIKSESIPWQDVTDLFEGSNLFGSKTLRKENFWSDKTKVSVAELFIDPIMEEVEQVNFTSHPYLINALRLNSLKQDIFAYPNPTLGKIRFNLINLPSGFYKVEIVNLLSLQVWEEDYYVNQSKTIKLDLSHLRRGTYFYRLVNEQEKTIATKRLIILKP